MSKITHFRMSNLLIFAGGLLTRYDEYVSEKHCENAFVQRIYRTFISVATCH